MATKKKSTRRTASAAASRSAGASRAARSGSLPAARKGIRRPVTAGVSAPGAGNVAVPPKLRAAVGARKADRSRGGPDPVIVTERRILGDIDEEVLGLAEEQLAVDKRRVETGRMRIHRHVVEHPVKAEVVLKNEHAQVSRTRIERPNTLADVDCDWTDDTFEMIESREEAVVTKRARIAEEVRLHKSETERTETIRDTVRKQEVEIECLDELGRVRQT